MAGGWRRPGRRFALAAVFLCAGTATAAELRLEGALMQGGLVRGTAEPGAQLTLDGKAVALTPDGAFILGFGRNAARSAILAVTWPDGRRETRKLAVVAREWRIQRIDGLPERGVRPTPEDLARIRAESALLAEVRRRTTRSDWWRHGFAWPASGKISGIYGSQRVLNGEPRQPHLGLDIAAPEGTVVLAAADGVVSLAHDDLFFTGKTVAIDHGLGLTSFYAHLSAVEVAPGAEVRRGQRIGRIGKTGRVTGAHLHWGLTWLDERLDPALAVASEPVMLGAQVEAPAAGGSGLRPAAMQP